MSLSKKMVLIPYSQYLQLMSSNKNKQTNTNQTGSGQNPPGIPPEEFDDLKFGSQNITSDGGLTKEQLITSDNWALTWIPLDD